MNELAALIHDQCCADTPITTDRTAEGITVACRRWDTDQRHREYYRRRAESIMTQLAPVIGEANVPVAVRVIIEEIW